MNRTRGLCFCIVLGFLLGAPSARGQRDEPPDFLTTIDVPGAAGTFAIDINANGEIVGRYMMAGRTHGFYRTTTGDLTTIDFPGSIFTVAAAINDDGDVVGMYRLPSDPTSVRHGYLRRSGEFLTIDPPGAIFTNVLGINERGDVVGRFCAVAPCTPGSGNFHGFTWSDGNFNTFDFPGAFETNLFKIASDGEILGGYLTAGGDARLFLARNDDATTIDLPGAPPITLDNAGVNARGDAVGTYCDFSPCAIVARGTHGFLRTRGGGFATIDIPGALATGASGINPRGDIVGLYFDASGKNHGFLLGAAPVELDPADPIEPVVTDGSR